MPSINQDDEAFLNNCDDSQISQNYIEALAAKELNIIEEEFQQQQQRTKKIDTIRGHIHNKNVCLKTRLIFFV